MNKKQAQLKKKIVSFFEKRTKDTWGTVLQVIFLLLICILFSLQSGHYANFFPINGTFQDFNPVRRMMAGQIPYKDFQDYLGMGHMYVGTLATILFGGTYQASIMAFTFLTMLSFVLISVVIGKAVFGEKKTALIMTNILLVLLITQPLFFANILVGSKEIKEALQYVLQKGNSARYIRGMILPLICMGIYFLDKVLQKLRVKHAFVDKYKDALTIAGAGVIAGFSFIWSNDYGISCWLCAFIMVFIISLARTKRILKAIGIAVVELIISLISIFIFAEIFTLGHFTNWFASTFGTGGYQTWYYNSYKSYYFFDVDFSYIMLLQAFLCIIYLIKLLKASGDKQSILRYGIPGFANMVGFCAVNEYQILSGGGSRQVALAVLFVSVLFEICRAFYAYFMSTKGLRGVLITIAVIVSMSWIVSDAKDEFIFWNATVKDGVYVPEMGGNMTSMANDLIDTNKFLGDDKFFATYSSAQEVMNNTFQPSGTDYIIHVLGDQQREDYLKEFKTGKFRYIATIKETFTPWEYWVQRANWFFYRELYKNWHPVYSNTYEMYWERNETNNQNTRTDNYSVRVENLSKSKKKIIVETDSTVNGVADVLLNYQVKKQDRLLAKLQLQQELQVENTGAVYATKEPYYESNYLRSEGEEYIPITVADGYGEVTITACPADSSYLVVNEASCKDIYLTTFDYIEVQNMQDNGNQAILSVEKDKKNKQRLKNAKELVIKGQSYSISKVEKSEDEDYFNITIETNGQEVNKSGKELKKGNVFQIIR